MTKKSKNYQLHLPEETRTIADEFPLLRTNLEILDVALKNISNATDNKADKEHQHAMKDVNGLEAALNGKMSANKEIKLGDLSDVSGANIAANNYVLAKQTMGFGFMSPAAALGQHNHKITDVINLETYLDNLAHSDNVYSKNESDSRFLEKTRGVFYGLNVDGAKLTLTTGKGNYEVNNFDSWLIGLPDIVFTINDNGHLILTV
ncbi:hypothetical protein [Bartonella sp. B17]